MLASKSKNNHGTLSQQRQITTTDSLEFWCFSFGCCYGHPIANWWFGTQFNGVIILKIFRTILKPSPWIFWNSGFQTIRCLVVFQVGLLVVQPWFRLMPIMATRRFPLRRCLWEEAGKLHVAVLTLRFFGGFFGAWISWVFKARPFWDDLQIQF